MIATRMLDKVRQLSIRVNFDVNGALEQCRENIKIIRAIEDYGFVRFSSKVHAFSFDSHIGMGIEDFVSHDLAWFNPSLKHNSI